MAAKNGARPWKSRIVGHGKVAVEELVANPRNWRIHPELQTSALDGAIDEVGYIRSISVNKSSGYVLDGHDRVLLAMKRGQRTIDVEWVDLTDEEEARAILYLDAITRMAAADRLKLKELIGEVTTENPALQQMLDDLAEWAGVALEVHIPSPTDQQEPELKGDHLIEIYCSAADLIQFQATLDTWSQRKGVTVNIS